jgi:hypothetical protein
MSFARPLSEKIGPYIALINLKWQSRGIRSAPTLEVKSCVAAVIGLFCTPSRKSPKKQLF